MMLIPLEAFAFRAVGLGFGPNIGLRGVIDNSYIIEGNWNPHKNVGARLFVGAIHGLWVGTALNTLFSVYESPSSSFDYSLNFSVPFIININNGVKTAFIGITAGNTLSFAVDKTHKYYFCITPFEFVFIPLTWALSPSGGFSNRLQISILTQMGFKVRL